MCDAWLAVITPLSSYIRHKVTKKVYIDKENIEPSLSLARIEIYFHVCSVRWTLYIGILTLSPAHLCRVTSYLDSKYWMITENNKGVTGVMLDDDNTTNILTTDSWLWWQWWHSWVSSQPLWSWPGMWPVYCDAILFVTEESPSQWVISTSVTRGDMWHSAFHFRAGEMSCN